ncbi:MAG TPA: respiratory nitrate reductase subunit gamma [Bryobacteraceae bacterium]|nr:respiratory nitrate reductase subunit gamma [Bryobacteraceae bacterium]
MNTTTHYLDQLLFNVLPYIAFFTFFLATIRRYRSRTFTYSSLSSQFLENRQHFWALVPLHYGILVVLAGHIVAFLVPRGILLWNSHPLRLYILEAAALIFGILTILGLSAAIVRRFTVSKLKIVTSPVDWLLFALLVLQAITGVAVALFYPWGSSWFSISATPYLWSLVRLNPDIGYITPMPWLVKLHIVNAYLLILLFPFTRLVHVLVIPNPYLWRKPQVVRWYRGPAGI